METKRKSTTQECEEYYFKAFCDAKGLSPKKVEYTDKPDVIINLNDKIIGIEITNFYINDGSLNESEQKQSAARERVIQKAQKLYNNENNIEVSFGFNTISKKMEKRLAKNISKFIESIDVSVSGSVSVDKFSNIPELKFVYVNSQFYHEPKWRSVQCHSLGLSDPYELSKKIAEKEEKSNEYKVCDEYWLLVVIDFINMGMDQEILNVDFSSIKSDVYEKVFLYKTCYEQIIEFSNNEPIKALAHVQKT